MKKYGIPKQTLSGWIKENAKIFFKNVKYILTEKKLKLKFLLNFVLLYSFPPFIPYSSNNTKQYYITISKIH